MNKYSQESTEAREYIVGGCQGRVPDSLQGESTRSLQEFAANPEYGYMPDSLFGVQNRSDWMDEIYSSRRSQSRSKNYSMNDDGYQGSPSVSDATAIAIVAGGVGAMALIVNPGILAGYAISKGAVIASVGFFSAGCIAVSTIREWNSRRKRDLYWKRYYEELAKDSKIKTSNQ